MTDEFVFNGIHATTGDYLLKPMTADELWEAYIQTPVTHPGASTVLDWLKTFWMRNKGTMLGGLDVQDAGWGLICPADLDERIECALEPLLALRRAQAGSRFKRLTYLPGETKVEFLSRHHVGLGELEPAEVPYHLLILGDARSIPFSFQFQLDVTYAVGRLSLTDTADYAAYARAVVASESKRRRLGATFVSVKNGADRATQLSDADLVRPLHEWAKNRFSGCDLRLVPGGSHARADKATLLSMLRDPATPSLLFTASHGLGFAASHPLREAHEGALLCQDWPGPRRIRQPITPDLYLSGDDIDETVDVEGLVAFMFACFGAGTPSSAELGGRRDLGATSNLARLPQRLLARGALAVVSHVDRAWSCSFRWQNDRVLSAFRGFIEAVLSGRTVGRALDPFNRRHAELASDYVDELGRVLAGKTRHDDVARLWIAQSDARAYVLLGDPAVRLAGEENRVTEPPEPPRP